MRCGRHCSPCPLTLAIQLETNGPCSRHIGVAPIGRGNPCINVERRTERPPEARGEQQINAERPEAAHRPIHQHEIYELLGHGTTQRSHSSREEHGPSEAFGHGTRVGSDERGTNNITGPIMVGHGVIWDSGPRLGYACMNEFPNMSPTVIEQILTG